MQRIESRKKRRSGGTGTAVAVGDRNERRREEKRYS